MGTGTILDDRNTHEHFAKIAGAYSSVRTTDVAPVRFICERLDGLGAIKAADVGCGDGRYDLLFFERLPQLHLTCIDINLSMLQELSRRLDACGIRRYQTVESGIDDVALPDASLDCVFTFNAIHHFGPLSVLKWARRVLRKGGGTFVYTRTPDQNEQTIWGRYFPDFTAMETRHCDLDDLTGSAEQVEGLRTVEVRTFEHSRQAGLDRLLSQARTHHYSTFSLYRPKEFASALKEFEANIRRQFPDPQRITWTDENVLLHIERAD